MSEYDTDSQIIEMYEHALKIAQDLKMFLYINGKYLKLQRPKGHIVTFNTVREVHHYLNGYLDSNSK